MPFPHDLADVSSMSMPCQPATGMGLPAMRQVSLNRTTVAVVLIVALAWFLPLGMRHLLPSDEGRYAEIAREMLASGDWVTIRYNDLKYFEKPPFQLWMTAIAYAAFGIGEWQARLWVALSGAFGLGISMVAAGRWFGPRVAAGTGLILLATPTWYIASHFNSLDMGVPRPWPACWPGCSWRSIRKPPRNRSATGWRSPGRRWPWRC